MEIAVRFTFKGGESQQLLFPKGTPRDDIVDILRDEYLLQDGYLSMGDIAITDSTNIDGKTVDFKGFKGIIILCIQYILSR